MADTSGITADSLKNKLIDTLQALHVEVEDLSGMDLFRWRHNLEKLFQFWSPLVDLLLTSCFIIGGCGQAFQAVIVSPQFESKTMLARHRLVNAALKDEIAAIHAWTPKCYTPEQWQALAQ
jgi:stress-induced morphogen